MKLTKYFKLFESRSSNLSEEEFFKILKDNCKDYINNPKPIQRMKESIDRYSYINPKIHTRTKGKADIATSLMLLLDNLPSWKDYPKRENSIIGFSTIEVSDSYSYGNEYYLIIPFDGSKFGSAPADDLWSTKISNIGNISYITLSTFQIILKKITSTPSSYSELISELQNGYDNFLIDENSIPELYASYVNIIKNIYNLFKKNDIKNVEDGINTLLSPDKVRGGINNENFNLYNYNELENKLREVWTDSECLLYYMGGYGYCGDCDGNGKIYCDECDGNGKIDCDECDGNGNIQCSCDGEGCENCIDGEIDCENCESGNVYCTECAGDGESECECQYNNTFIISTEQANDIFNKFVNKIKGL